MSVEYIERGSITDVIVDNVYMGSVTKGDDGKYRTTHRNNAPSGTFTVKHFATYHVEKAKPL